MPAITRSSKMMYVIRESDFGAGKSTVDEFKKRVVPLPVRTNMKWTKAEERDLIRMCRQTEMTPDQMAVVLHRSEEAIRYRLAKIFHEHLDGRTDEAAVLEVSNWLLPN